MLTSGDYGRGLARWSPDGKSLRNSREQAASRLRSRQQLGPVWLDAAPRRRRARQLTTSRARDNDPDTESGPRGARRPLHRLLAGRPAQAHSTTPVQKLAVVPARRRAPAFSRQGSIVTRRTPCGRATGRPFYFLLEDDRAVGLAARAAAGGAIERLVSGSRVVSAFAAGANGKVAVLASTALAPAECSRLTAPRCGRCHSERRVASRVKLAPCSRSASRPRRHGGQWLRGEAARLRVGKRYPTIPAHSRRSRVAVPARVRLQLQTLAGHGYLVIVANPRAAPAGESNFTRFRGLGEQGCPGRARRGSTMWWRRGSPIPRGLGVGGWSTAGSSPNYVIAQDHRFKGGGGGAASPTCWPATARISMCGNTRGSGRAVEDRRDLSCCHSRSCTPTGSTRRPVPVRRQGLQRAAPSLGADVPGAQKPGRGNPAVIYPGTHHAINKPTLPGATGLERYLVWYDKHLK